MRLQLLRWVARPMLRSLAGTREKLFSPKLLLYTNAGITVCMSITGDTLQQWYQARRKQKPTAWDRTRTTRLAGTGLLISPFVHYWYVFLDKWLPQRTFRVLCKKVILDQVICSPVYLCLFMLSLCYMENRSWPEVKANFAKKGRVLFIAEWAVWPPAQFINFFFLPTKYRVLFDNTISFAFDCFWSYVWYDMEGEKEDDSIESSQDS
ncbi:hypothetical protein ACOMHN_004423 [Nucella lapillus]